MPDRKSGKRENLEKFINESRPAGVPDDIKNGSGKNIGKKKEDTSSDRDGVVGSGTTGGGMSRAATKSSDTELDVNKERNYAENETEESNTGEYAKEGSFEGFLEDPPKPKPD